MIFLEMFRCVTDHVITLSLIDWGQATVIYVFIIQQENNSQNITPEGQQGPDRETNKMDGGELNRRSTS